MAKKSRSKLGSLWHRLLNNSKVGHSHKRRVNQTSYDPGSIAEEIKSLRKKGRYKTALNLLLPMLETQPPDKRILRLTASILYVAQNPSYAYKAIEPLTEEHFFDNRLDPIYCECSVCKTFWISQLAFSPIEFDLSESVFFDSPGGVCNKCNKIFCRKCAAGYKCPNCKVKLTPITEPNGRSPRQIPKSKQKVTMVLVFREGPVPPDREYVTKFLRTVSPDILQQNIEIIAIPTFPWPDTDQIIVQHILEVFSETGVIPAFDYSFYQDESKVNLCVAKIYEKGIATSVLDDIEFQFEFRDWGQIKKLHEIITRTARGLGLDTLDLAYDEMLYLQLTSKTPQGLPVAKAEITKVSSGKLLLKISKMEKHPSSNSLITLLNQRISNLISSW